jgi:hypothetical protein
MLHLRAGIEVADSADLLCGSATDGIPGIRQMSQMPAFQQSKGWKRAPVTKAWLEDAIALRAAVAAMETLEPAPSAPPRHPASPSLCSAMNLA